MSEVVESFMISDDVESGMIVRGIDIPAYNISSNDFSCLSIAFFLHI